MVSAPPPPHPHGPFPDDSYSSYSYTYPPSSYACDPALYLPPPESSIENWAPMSGFQPPPPANAEYMSTRPPLMIPWANPQAATAPWGVPAAPAREPQTIVVHQHYYLSRESWGHPYYLSVSASAGQPTTGSAPPPPPAGQLPPSAPPPTLTAYTAESTPATATITIPTIPSPPTTTRTISATPPPPSPPSPSPPPFIPAASPSPSTTTTPPPPQSTPRRPRRYPRLTLPQRTSLHTLVHVHGCISRSARTQEQITRYWLPSAPAGLDLRQVVGYVVREGRSAYKNEAGKVRARGKWMGFCRRMGGEGGGGVGAGEGGQMEGMEGGGEGDGEAEGEAEGEE